MNILFNLYNEFYELSQNLFKNLSNTDQKIKSFVAISKINKQYENIIYNAPTLDMTALKDISHIKAEDLKYPIMTFIDSNGGCGIAMLLKGRNNPYVGGMEKRLGEGPIAGNTYVLIYEQSDSSQPFLCVKGDKNIIAKANRQTYIDTLHYPRSVTDPEDLDSFLTDRSTIEELMLDYHPVFQLGADEKGGIP